MNDSPPEPGVSRAAESGSEAPLCAVSDIPEGQAIARTVASSGGGFVVILTRLGARVSAFHDECPHAGRRLDWAPGQFLIELGHLVCAAHGAAFTLDTGYCVGGPCRGQALLRFPVRVEAGLVYPGR